MQSTHHYTLDLLWLGDPKNASIKQERLYEVHIEGKPNFRGSADKPFYGDPSLYNPEDLLLAALSACHMMSFFYVCRKAGVKVLDYQDSPMGTLKLNVDGSGQFEVVTLKPTVKLADEGRREELPDLHIQAGKLCFIKRSVNFPVKVQ